MLLNIDRVKNEIKKKSKVTLKEMKMRTQEPSIPKREIHNITGLTQEATKVLKELEKNNTQSPT